MTENTTLTNFTFNKLSFIKLESGKNKHNLNKMPQFSHIHPVITKKFHCSKSKSPISTALLGLTTWLWCGMADNVGCLCQTEGCKTDKESDLWPGNNKQLRQPISSWFIHDDFTTQLPVQIYAILFSIFFCKTILCARLNPSGGVCLSFLVLVIWKTMISVMNACVMLQCLGSVRHGPETVLSCLRTL